MSLMNATSECLNKAYKTAGYYFSPDTDHFYPPVIKESWISLTSFGPSTDSCYLWTINLYFFLAVSESIISDWSKRSFAILTVLFHCLLWFGDCFHYAMVLCGCLQHSQLWRYFYSFLPLNTLKSSALACPFPFWHIPIFRTSAFI